MPIDNVAEGEDIETEWGNDVADTINAIEIDITTIEANDWVTTSRIANANVTTAKLAPGAVDTTKIAAATITGGNIAAGAILNSHIQAGEVTTSSLNATVLSDAWILHTTPILGWSGHSAWYKRLGNIVWFRFQGAQVGSGGTYVFTLPPGYYPSSTMYFPGGVNMNTGANAGFQIDSSTGHVDTGVFGAGSVGHVWAFECWFPV